jgi:hypothetical protein
VSVELTANMPVAFSMAALDTTTAEVLTELLGRNQRVETWRDQTRAAAVRRSARPARPGQKADLMAQRCTLAGGLAW